MNKKYGLILEPIETREQGAEHLLGSIFGVDGPVINPSGDWSQWLPDKEPQMRRGVETQACTCYATLSALETLIFHKTGKAVNYSDRYLAIVGKVDPYRGADPHRIAECVRKTAGCLAESKLPWTDDVKTPEDYYGIPQAIITQLMHEGTRWYDEYELAHEWVFQGGTPESKRKLLQEALKKGPVCVSVSAWYYENDKRYYYKPPGTLDNHWTVLAAAPPGKYVVFDSYDGYLKDLDPLYDFQVAKVYYLTSPSEKRSLIAKILTLIGQALGLIQKQLPALVTEEKPRTTQPESNKPIMENTIYLHAKSIIGMDASPKDLVQDGLGCAESVSTLLKAIVPGFPTVTGTWTLFDVFRARPDFVSVTDLEPGDIILCVTGMGNGKVPHGHVGVVSEDTKIMSNNSNNGLWEENFTLRSWKDYYVTKGGYPLKAFRYTKVD